MTAKKTSRTNQDVKIFFAHPAPKLHFTYQEMLDNPPAGFSYINKDSFDKDYASVSSQTGGLKSKVFGLLSYLPIPTYARVDADCDMVYASQCIPLTKKPWIMDVEFPEGVARFHPRLFKNPLMRYLIRRNLLRDECKGIVFWSKASRDGFAKVIGDDIVKKKGIVIRPAISKDTARERKPLRKEKLALFVGRDFLRKGGLEAVTAFERVVKKHKNARFVVVTKMPDDIKPSDYPHVTFMPKLERERLLREYYPKASVYLMPSWHDTIVLVWLEAMRYSVPIIALRDYASAEVVPGNGILVESYNEQWFTSDKLTNTKYPTIERLATAHTKKEFERIVFDIAKALDKLFSDKELAAKLGEHGKMMVTTGEFSMDYKNKKMTALFKKALS